MPWRSVRSGEPSDPRRYGLLRCDLCRSLVTDGPPPGPAAYETGVYAPKAPRARPLVEALQRATVVQPVRLLRRAGVAPGARVLDAGAGRGRIVAALRRAGYDADGIDPSGRGKGIARASLDEYTDSGLDAVVLWHVLEHLEDPARALRRAASWLAPGGVLLVAVPNAASLQARIGGASWLHWDAPRHRLHLTPRGLDSLVGTAGLRLERTVHMVWEHNPAGMWMAMLSRSVGMTPGLPFHLLKRNVDARPRDAVALLLGVPLAPLAVAVEAAAAATGRGGTIAALARAPR